MKIIFHVVEILCFKIQVKERERNNDGDDKLTVEMMEYLDQQDVDSTPLNFMDELDIPLPAHLSIQDIVMTLKHQNPQTDFFSSRRSCV